MGGTAWGRNEVFDAKGRATRPASPSGSYPGWFFLPMALPFPHIANRPLALRRGPRIILISQADVDGGGRCLVS
jgi:hypothetical protein